VGAAFDLVHWAEDSLAAMEGARVKGLWWLRAGDIDRGRDGGGGLRARGAVAEVGVGVGAEEEDDENRGENFYGVACAAEARHFAGRGGGVGGSRRVGGGWHGSFRLGTASHGWDMGGAGFCKIQGSLRCAALRSR